MSLAADGTWPRRIPESVGAVLHSRSVGAARLAVRVKRIRRIDIGIADDDDS